MGLHPSVGGRKEEKATCCETSRQARKMRKSELGFGAHKKGAGSSAKLLKGPSWGEVNQKEKGKEPRQVAGGVSLPRSKKGGGKGETDM